MSFYSSRSANSEGKSKRSLHSNSSNRSEKLNNKKKSRQKTLGMAWGSNSLSSSKSSTRKSPFTDFGSYMEVKNRKLRDQFDADASTSSLGNSNSGTDLFRGISIFVDGFTVPSNQELRGLMLKHGGRFENYFSRNRVTHIVCSNLPDSKIKNLRSFSGGLPVVKPTWVLESVAANRVLNWVPYQLEQLVHETRKQQKLSAFFLKSDSNSEDIETAHKVCAKLESEDELSNGDAHKGSTLPEVGESITYDSHGEESACFGPEKPYEVRTDESRLPDSEDEHNVREELRSSLNRSSASVSSCCVDHKNSKEPLDSTSVGPSNKHHSTLGDPNFVENYFKNSRLHFIGTWRNRYRKRFPNLLNGVKCVNRNIDACTASNKTSIIHIDMDCFFVSVIVRNHPELSDKPVAVCHSDNPKGTAEISSANYPARDYGVRAGMFVRDAKALCPHLVIIPYNFAAYEEVADQFYNVLHKYCKKVQAVSCDEAFLDVTDLEGDNPEHLASIIRQEIVETTGCTASAGIAENMLMARLATRTAKPNGQCFIPSEKVDDYLNNLPIKALPGIGHALEAKLKSRHIQTCGQLHMISKEALQKDFGTKTGDMLWNYSRGVDNRSVDVVQGIKSVGAEVNWGVRFDDIKDSQHFLLKLCKEVSLRLQGCGMQGRTITLKIKKRKKGAEEPTKYMGCGDCENLSHSLTVPTATDDIDVLQRISKHIFGSFHIDVKEIRGIGLQVSRLESADMAKQGHQKTALRSWLASASGSPGQLSKTFCTAEEGADGDCGNPRFDGNSCQIYINETGSSYQMHIDQFHCEARVGRVSTLPPLSHLDMEVVENLPPEILSEMNEMYSGRLTDFMKKIKDKNDRKSTFACNITKDALEGAFSSSGYPKVECDTILEHRGHSDYVELNSVARNKGKQPIYSPPVLDNVPIEKKAKESSVQEIQSASTSFSGFPDLQITTVGSGRVDLMPASLSQVDISVLQQLPDAMKVDILELLPAHRTSECLSNAAIGSMRESTYVNNRLNTTGNSIGVSDSVSNDNLWIGNPPKWVEKFKDSNFLILNILAETYYRSGSTGLLSSILRCIISSPSLSLDSTSQGWDISLSSFCDLLKQYIEIKIKSDIEEIYICFQLLKSRFAIQSGFLLQAYNIVLPFLQASVSENYGGNLQLSHEKV